VGISVSAAATVSQEKALQINWICFSSLATFENSSNAGADDKNAPAKNVSAQGGNDHVVAFVQ
jgi:hypothetical protein